MFLWVVELQTFCRSFFIENWLFDLNPNKRHTTLGGLLAATAAQEVKKILLMYVCLYVRLYIGNPFFWSSLENRGEFKSSEVNWVEKSRVV